MLLHTMADIGSCRLAASIRGDAVSRLERLPEKRPPPAEHQTCRGPGSSPGRTGLHLPGPSFCICVDIYIYKHILYEENAYVYKCIGDMHIYMYITYTFTHISIYTNIEHTCICVYVYAMYRVPPRLTYASNRMCQPD